MSLARASTRAETQLARLLVLAAEHCRDVELADVPHAIRSNMKTLSRCRSAICALAMAAEEHGHSEQLAA
jgi:Ni,Fe-hydrogenase III large subunit